MIVNKKPDPLNLLIGIWKIPKWLKFKEEKLKAMKRVKDKPPLELRSRHMRPMNYLGKKQFKPYKYER